MEQLSFIFYCAAKKQIRHTLPPWARRASTPVTDGHGRMPTLLICFKYQCHHCSSTQKPVTICLIQPVPLKQVSQLTAAVQLMKSRLLLRESSSGILILGPGTPGENRGKHLPSDLMKACCCSIWLPLNKCCFQLWATLNTLIKRRSPRKEMSWLISFVASFGTQNLYRKLLDSNVVY